MDLVHAFLRNRVRLFNQRADFWKAGADFLHDGITLHTGVHPVELPLEMVEQGRLMEQFRSVLCVILGDHLGQRFRATQPPAQAHKLGKLLVLKLDHGLFHILRSPVKLHPDSRPILLVSGLNDAAGSGNHRFPDANRTGKIQYVPANLFDLLGLLSLHGDKPLCDHGSEQESHLGPFPELGAVHLAEHVVPVGRAKFVEHPEDLGRNGDDDVVNNRGGKSAHIDAARRLVLCMTRKGEPHGQRAQKRG